jgi:hypothetical protein
MSCPELEVAAGQLTSVRLRNYILKRGTGIMKGWSHRYVVVSANFLYMYMNDKVRMACGCAADVHLRCHAGYLRFRRCVRVQDVKPRRIVGLDGSNVSVRMCSFRLFAAVPDSTPDVAWFQEAPEPIARKQPNAFKLTTRTGAELFFSCETKEETDKVTRIAKECCFRGRIAHNSPPVAVDVRHSQCSVRHYGSCTLHDVACSSVCGC